MGNTPSTERPRRAPQKLSKPRVGNHAASTTNNILSPNPSSPSNALSRYSSSHVVGAPPAPPPDTIGGSPVAGHAIPNEDAGPRDLTVQTEALPEAKLMRSSTSPSQSQTKNISRRKSTGVMAGQSLVADGNRRLSMRHKGELSPLTPVTGPGAATSCRASHYELASPDAQRALNTSPVIAQQLSPVPSPRLMDGFSEPEQAVSHQQRAMEALISRSQSEPSQLYAPTRRRSAILTPGVATRSEPSDMSTATRPIFRMSVPPTLSESRKSSSESLAEMRLSMPPQYLTSVTTERVATPSEEDYQQIGGMKFGSLRITNATPVPSPALENGPGAPEDDGDTSTSAAKSFSEMLTPSDSTSPSAETKHPKPLSGAVSPVVTTFGEASTNGATSSTDGFPFSPPTGGCKSDDVRPLTPTKMQPSKSATPDTLGVEEDPNGNRSRSSNTPVEKRKSTMGMARSDSGVGSLFSSDSQQETVSTRDSGYGSSLSLKSIFGSMKASRQGDDNASGQPAAVHGGGQKDHSSDRHSANEHSQEHSRGPGENDNVTSSDQPTSVSRGNGFLGSFRARKSRESQTQSRHSRGTSSPDVPTTDIEHRKSNSSSGASTGSQKSKKLHKLVSAARRRSLPSKLPSHPRQEDVPSMPPDAAEKLREHYHLFEGTSKHGSFQERVGREDLSKTSVRVGNKEVSEKWSTRHTTTAMEDKPPRPQSMGSILHRQASLSTKGPALRRKSILRRSKPAAESPDDFDDDDAAVPDYMLSYEAQGASIASIRRIAGNSAFDAAFVPMAEDKDMGPNSRRIPPAGARTARPRGSYPRLRTRSSAPDFLETVSEPASPGSVDCYSQKKPKTPPPVSIRTRGSKKKRLPRASHPASHGVDQHPPLPDMQAYDGRRGEYARDEDLRQSLRSYPVPRPQKQFDGPEHGSGYVGYGMRPLPSRAPHASPIIRSKTHVGRYPANSPQTRPPLRYDHNIPYHPGSGSAQEPPYRVLHSYNSPVSQGVSIRS